MSPLTDVTRARDLFDETEARHRRFALGIQAHRPATGWHVLQTRKARPRSGEVETLPDGTKRVHMTRRDWIQLMRNRPECHDDAALDSEV